MVVVFGLKRSVIWSFYYERAKPRLIHFGKTAYQSHEDVRTYASILESRIDVLLLRSHFVDDIYRARNLIFHGKCKVRGLVELHIFFNYS